MCFVTIFTVDKILDLHMYMTSTAFLMMNVYSASFAMDFTTTSLVPEQMTKCHCEAF